MRGFEGMRRGALGALGFVAVTGAVLVSAMAAWADGGTSIAAAPELPLGSRITSGVARLDYWRVTIVPGDTLSIDYESLTDAYVGVCLMTPDVTDFTLSDASCTDRRDTDYVQGRSKRQTLHTLAVPGRYTLVVGDYNYCMGSRVSVKCDRPVAYGMTAYVIHRTSTVVTRPARFIKRGSAVRIAGRVNGASGGAVAVQQRVAGTWKNIKIAKLSAAGAFTSSFKARLRGAFRGRVMYPGDDSHRPSSAGFSFTVV